MSALWIPTNYTLNTSLGTILKNPGAKAILEQMMPQNDMASSGESEAITKELMAAMMESMLLRQMAGLVPGINPEDMEKLIMVLNQN